MQKLVIKLLTKQSGAKEELLKYFRTNASSIAKEMQDSFLVARLRSKGISEETIAYYQNETNVSTLTQDSQFFAASEKIFMLYVENSFSGNNCMFTRFPEPVPPSSQQNNQNNNSEFTGMYQGK